MDIEEILHKEIDLIQGIIHRMANNSFLLKGWVVTLIVAVLALTSDTLITNDITYFSLILLVPLICFWYLDAFFLHKEKCYRRLYKWVINNRSSSNDFLYDLNYKRFVKEEKCVFSIMFTTTLFIFYGVIAFILIGITIYNLSNG